MTSTVRICALRHALAALIAAFALGSVLLHALPAEAAKPSIITKFAGDTSIVRASPNSNWVACWTLLKSAEYVLYLINAENGEKKEVVKVKEPGGICWVPNQQKLVYCKGVPTGVSDVYQITYYVYDIATAKSKKLLEVKDKFKTYTLDPIASEDGSKVFHVTISPPPTSLPSFNIYYPAQNLMIPIEVKANITTDYDLGADGETVYWYLRNETNGYLYITGWNIAKDPIRMGELYEYPKSMNPADGYLMIRADAPNYQVAMLAASEKDPTLQLCVYGFRDPKKLSVVPLRLNETEEFVFFDWKDRGGNIFAVVHNTANDAFSIEEFNVFDGSRSKLMDTPDTVFHVDYSPRNNTYYYAVTDRRNAKDPQTMILRLK